MGDSSSHKPRKDHGGKVTKGKDKLMENRPVVRPAIALTVEPCDSDRGVSLDQASHLLILQLGGANPPKNFGAITEELETHTFCMTVNGTLDSGFVRYGKLWEPTATTGVYAVRTYCAEDVMKPLHTLLCGRLQRRFPGLELGWHLMEVIASNKRGFSGFLGSFM